MSSETVGYTKNNLSAILSALTSGKESEHVIKLRNIPIATIRPIQQPTSRAPFGFAKQSAKHIDFDAFDALDSEIAEEFGA
ncbi:MAG: hypothetical protein IJ111_12470 [Eggerthellaceae bacterium]|nr:hypothetical protein [Eggerthellaceae bacterium]